MGDSEADDNDDDNEEEEDEEDDEGDASDAESTASISAGLMLTVNHNNEFDMCKYKILMVLFPVFYFARS